MSHVAIVILNWNGLKDTLACLSSVYRSEYKNFQVIVVDNNSSDNELISIKRNYPEIIEIQSEINLGFTGGCNLGIKYAIQNDAEFVWLLNNDACVDPKCLTHLICAVQNDPKIGLASPVIFNNSSDNQLLYCGVSVDLERGLKYQAQSLTEIGEWQNSKPETICLWGTALLIKSALIKKIGLFDDTFFAYYEDMDYSVRSIRNGYKNIVVHDAHIFHSKKISTNNPVHFYFYMIRNEYFFWRKYLLDQKGYCKKYIGSGIVQSAFHYLNGATGIGDAIIDGVWNAAKEKHGDYANRQKVPSWLRSSVSRHPRMWRKLVLFLLK